MARSAAFLLNSTFLVHYSIFLFGSGLSGLWIGKSYAARNFLYVDNYAPMGYNYIMRFIETPIFTRELGKFLQDEEYRELQLVREEFK
jgi:hypothetical protein